MKDEISYPVPLPLQALGPHYQVFHTRVKSNFDALFLAAGIYSTALAFTGDRDIYKDATGLSITFTLDAAVTPLNGSCILLRLNKPTAVTFPANFEASPSSVPLDSTKLNVYSLVYFSSWDGAGTGRVIYTNTLFTGL